MYYEVSKIEFVMALTKGRDQSHKIKTSVTHPCDLSDEGYYYLHADDNSGFGLVPTEYGYDLVALWSLIPGRGDDMINYAVSLGANTLDCYDGFLVNYYVARGWLVYDRQPNFTEGDPDVVFLTL